MVVIGVKVQCVYVLLVQQENDKDCGCEIYILVFFILDGMLWLNEKVMMVYDNMIVEVDK